MPNSSRVKLGVLLPTRGLFLGDQPPADADLLFRMAQCVEAAGLDSLWVGDSLIAKPRLEPLSALAALAARTQRVRLGTAVLLMALRHPVLLAQTLATVDLISRGRLVIAAGVGGAFNAEQQKEWRTAGVDVARRARRLEEMAQIVKALGRGESVTMQGRHFQLDDVALPVRPVQPGGVPLLLACHWRFRREAQLRRAAKWGDGIISISDTPQEYAEMVPHVRRLAAEEGRDASKLEMTMYTTVNLHPDPAQGQRDAETFLLRYYGANIWGDRWGPFGDAQRVKARLHEYADAGAQTIIVRFASLGPERQLDMFLEKVAPAFQ